MDELVQIEHIQGLMYGIANYRKKEEFEAIFDNYKKSILEREKDFQPLDKYQMELYGQNRIVTLRFPILNPPDSRVKGPPALYYLYEDSDGDTSVQFLSLAFYLPKGKPLSVDNLQIL